MAKIKGAKNLTPDERIRRLTEQIQVERGKLDLRIKEKQVSSVSTISPAPTITDKTFMNLEGLKDENTPIQSDNEKVQQTVGTPDIRKETQETKSIIEITPELVEEGLTDLAEQDFPRYIQNAIKWFNKEEYFAVHPITRGRAALWAKFARPVLEKYFPYWKDKPLIVFVILTVSMGTSMVEVKKSLKQVKQEIKEKPNDVKVDKKIEKVEPGLPGNE